MNLSRVPNTNKFMPWIFRNICPGNVTDNIFYQSVSIIRSNHHSLIWPSLMRVILKTVTDIDAAMLHTNKLVPRSNHHSSIKLILLLLCYTQINMCVDCIITHELILKAVTDTATAGCHTNKCVRRLHHHSRINTEDCYWYCYCCVPHKSSLLLILLLLCSTQINLCSDWTIEITITHELILNLILKTGTMVTCRRVEENFYRLEMLFNHTVLLLRERRKHTLFNIFLWNTHKFKNRKQQTNKTKLQTSPK